MECIVYKGGYKYQLKKTWAVRIEIIPDVPVDTEYIRLSADGDLTIVQGYAWDGPSGPTIDTLSFMRGSLVHDALYQLMREGYLDRALHRKTADCLLRRICLEDGMCLVRAWLVYQGVRFFANPAADPADDRPLSKAPQGCAP